jgi:hypothetical protein
MYFRGAYCLYNQVIRSTSRLYWAISQKAIIFILAAVRTWHLTSRILLCKYVKDVDTDESTLRAGSGSEATSILIHLETVSFSQPLSYFSASCIYFRVIVYFVLPITSLHNVIICIVSRSELPSFSMLTFKLQAPRVMRFDWKVL